MWKSCDLSTWFYDKMSGSYTIGMDSKTRRFTLESSNSHLVKFCLSFIPLSLSVTSCILRAWGPPLFGENPIQIFIISFGEAVVILVGMTVGIIAILHGEELVDLMNHSYVLLEDTSKTNNFRNCIQTRDNGVLFLCAKGNFTMRVCNIKK